MKVDFAHPSMFVYTGLIHQLLYASVKVIIT